MLEEFRKNFRVDVIYFKDAEDDDYSPTNANVRVIRVVPNSLSYRRKNALRRIYYHPLFTVRFDDNLLKWIQTQINLNNYDIIVFDHSQTFLYARKLLFRGEKILLSHDIEAQRVMRSSNYILYKLCLYTEKYVLNTPKAHLFALCQKDVDLISRLYGLHAEVVNIYIDKRIETITSTKISDVFVLFGNWIRRDNYEGALWLLNGLGHHLSAPIDIYIIGKKFPIEQVIVHNNIKINNLGYVDNPYPIISECKAILCPLFSGAGIKVKVIEALASGTPVLGTEIAFEGFSKKYSKFMIQCNGLKEFANKIETISFSIDERLEFKKMFLEDYTSDSIPEWISRYNAQLTEKEIS